MWIKCLWPQTTCTYTLSRVYIGISHLWLLHKSMWIEKNTLLTKCLWPQTTCTYTISRVYIGISHLWLWHKSMWIEKKVCESNVYDLKLLVHTLSHELWLLHKSMWIDSLWMKCLLLVHTLSHEFIGISHLWILHKSISIEKNSLWSKFL